VTRLQSSDIADIPLNFNAFDHELKSKTDHTLRQLACKAVGIGETVADTVITDCSVGVIPTTCGQGVIGGFSETISKIAVHLGFLSEVTLSTDVAGLAEAMEKQSDIVLMADDHRFIAIHLPTGRLADNSAATGKGFATGLDLMADNLNGRKVLVLGAGPVGRSAAQTLLLQGAAVSIYDPNRHLCLNLACDMQNLHHMNIHIEKNLKQALSAHLYLIDATPMPDFIPAGLISQDTIVAAPGVPVGLTVEALKKIDDRLLYDCLQIGVATMLMELVQHIDTLREREQTRKKIKVQ
jgi:pyrrolysine biosynthesis protein PylD